jgi:hypothetical protein
MAQDYAVINVEPVDAKIRQSCKNCVKYEFCREICPEVEDLLPRPQGGCKNKIKHYTPDVLEDMANRRALKYKGLAARKMYFHEDYD